MQYIKHELGICDYRRIRRTMRLFSLMRNNLTIDEIWALEHYPIITTGYKSNNKDILKYTSIPYVKTERGGMVTYHAPGQIVVYLLINIKRSKLRIKKVILIIEKLLEMLLKKCDAMPEKSLYGRGIFIKRKKVASIGMKVFKGCTYHGFSLNIDVFLIPFKYINICGHKKLLATNLSNTAMRNKIILIPTLLLKKIYMLFR